MLFGNNKKAASSDAVSVSVKRNDVRLVRDLQKLDYKQLSSAEQKQLAKEMKVPKRCADLVPIKKVYPYQKIMEMSDGTYTKQYFINDIDFKPALDEDQETIYKLYAELINYFSTDVRVELTIFNRTLDRDELLEKISLRHHNDDLEELREEYNSIIKDKVYRSKSPVKKEKYLTVTVKADSILVAEQVFTGVDEEIKKKFMQLTRVETEPMSIKDRLAVFYDIFCMDDECAFDDISFVRFCPQNEELGLDYESLNKAGLSVKDLVAPKSFEQDGDYLKFGKKYTQSLFLFDVSNEIEADILSSLTSLGCNLICSVHYFNIDPGDAEKLIKRRQADIRGQIYKVQENAASKGVSATIMSPALSDDDENLQYTRTLLRDSDQRMVTITLCITVFADTKESLKKNVDAVIKTASQKFYVLEPMVGVRFQPFITSLPAGMNALNVSRQMLTESAACFLPFEAQDADFESGQYIGVNVNTKNITFINRSKIKPNGNEIVTGTSGSGKSFMVKKEMYANLLSNGRDEIYVVDPQGEYLALARALGGQVFDLNAADKSDVAINVMDMDINSANTDEGDHNPIGMKSDYLVGLCESLDNTDIPLGPQVANLIDRYCKQLYTPYVNYIREERAKGNDISIDYDRMPVIRDLYELARADSSMDESAARIADTIEKLAVGNFSNFSQKTNIDVRSRFIVYNTKDIGKNMKKTASYIALSDAWNRAVRNYYKGINTYIIIDEIHTFMKDKAIASSIEEYWKMGRKWRVLFTGITQDAEDLLSSKEGRTLFNNSGVKISMQQAKIGKDILAEMLNLSEMQIRHMVSAAPGSGIISYGNVTLCIEDDIPKGTRMYKILSTSAD